MIGIQQGSEEQAARNTRLLAQSRYLGSSTTSDVLPFQIDISGERLSADQVGTHEALSIQAARTAIKALGSLAKINEVDHLGGGLDLIPPLLLTLAVTDYDKVEYTIEHAHTSIGYFSALAALGFLEEQDVVDGFRRGLDVPGHVSWLPGGTPLNGGRLGVMIPTAVGQALGKRAVIGDGSWVVVHCGDAGWISGQALNGFNGASVHEAPITFVMHRNGIQLSGTTKSILDRDPRPVIESLGVEIIEIPTLHDVQALYEAYRHANACARRGKASLIYPVGFRSGGGVTIDLSHFGESYGVTDAVSAFAQSHGVSMSQQVWIPGALMSFRDVGSMIECLFLVNGLPGGEGHHDGSLKGRDEAEVLANPMLQFTAAHDTAMAALRSSKQRRVTTKARPAPGSPNLVLPKSALNAVDLPEVGETVSARNGSEAGYAAVAKAFPENVFVVSCDLDPSTKLSKARGFIAPDHQFEMSIEEQAATLLADGLAMSSNKQQLNVVSTFAAFYEGIAREGFDMWRYQRNLTGVNEGLNVTFHVSHVGACTGRDHFSGWGLDWINIGLTYLPYLHRFYAPADARSAFLAVRDLAAHYGGHIIGIPRDNLPILTNADGNPLWNADSAWEAVTEYRLHPGAERAIVAMGAPAFVADDAAEQLAKRGLPTDVYIVNGLPLPPGALEGLLATHTAGIVTVEDGFIGTRQTGVRGFAGLVSGLAGSAGLPCAHVGVTDPRIAPADGHMETWGHFGITAEAIAGAVSEL